MTAQHLTDAELAAQPVAHWTGLAYEATLAHIRAHMAELGTSQPQFWILRNLSRHDLSPDGHGRTIPQLREAMATYLRPEDDLAAEADLMLAKGWLTRDGEARLWITGAGEEARTEIRRHAPAVRARMHEGVDDADYVTTVKVLRRMIRNAGDPAGVLG
ncbi:winged helix-turn-helix transcriptional regulator [Streptomyces roseirectus]|uniref:Winged helix-turn-helix transcriptional regulator n=1 Tax=Streptomyces roseirectus TaxID=2768066 RepID=A0A7H0IP84_9ACTN|nr:MarR family winged helix-turn-helix transcriptional regulator [Streptomyces roseirectus]QNP74600.1 winged helix-turn-helix transcriptional regulator [Streptomyces roseirectus]